ncbi:hypothetical protein [Neisseria elongata]|uniref:hypothetical protein n=1 Tax=Neisseria elongata TaxID=495 RepID=UPI00195A699A|nr:hypothetical protein [Neisseria elongata]MBM7064852.1 hypothetical protein [Neisseria elongata]
MQTHCVAPVSTHSRLKAAGRAGSGWRLRGARVSTQNAANPVLPILNVGFSFRNYAFLAVFLCNKIKDRKIFAEHIIIIRESVRKNLLLQINVVEKISNNTCITTFKVVLYAHGQTTRPAENVINQLTAYGRIGVKK